MSGDEPSPGPARDVGPDAPAPTRPGASTSRARRRARRAEGGTGPRPGADEPLIPTRSREDTDEAWGERPSASEDDEDERFLRDVPPHW